LKKESAAPKNVEDVYPLSPMQEGMLFHSLYAPGSGVYITQVACTLDGLRVDPFRRAWQTVVDRHPILRTAFVWKNTPRLIQVVGRQVGVPLEQQDWRELTPVEQSEQWGEHVRADRHRDFDFGKAPLLRLSLVRMGEETWRLLWTCHHILLDGWCVALVLREVFALYQTFCEGEDERAVGLGAPRPYRTYIGWLQQQDRAAAETFWRSVLQGFTTPTPVEMGGAPDAAESRAGYGRERLFLDEAATTAAELLARRHNLTLNTLALGAWALFLGHASGEPEVLFGTVASGRPPELPGVEEIVGPFLNTLPLRVPLDPGQSVLAWLGSIQNLQVDMRQYEHTPLADLQKWSDLPAGRQLFDSVLAFENYPRPESTLSRLPGLAVRDVWSDEQTNFPLSVSFAPVGGRLMINVFYERARYERTAIQRLLGHVATLLGRIVAGPGLRLGELSSLSEAERHQLEVEWSDTRVPRDGTPVHRLFEAQAARTPEAVALVDGERQVTYRELEERANQLAHHLRRLGVAPRGLVGLCLERSAALVESLLATWKAGAAYLPLDPSLPSERLAFLLADSGVPLLLTDAASAPSLPDHGARVLRLDAAAESIAAESAERPADGSSAGDLAYLIYTSGTTGRPKAVLVEHGNLANVLLACRERFPLPGGGAMPHLASFSFDISLFELFTPLLAGGRSILVGRHEILDVPRLAAGLRGVAAVHGVPSLLRQIVDHLRERGDALADGPSIIFTGGDAVPPDLLAGLREVFPASRLVVLYGPTEGTILGSAWPLEEGAPARALIGRPLANVEPRVVDARLRTVPAGVAGELCLGGAGVARGYLGREELTRERFVELEGRRFYRTGDLVRWRPDGNLEFLGRIDDQVKIHGFRVELGEIEAVLREHPEVAEAAVLAPLEGAGRRLAAWLVAAGPAPPAVAGLRAWLGRKLPAYMVPAAFSFLPALPLTAHGKVDRRALALLDRSGEVRAAAVRDFTAPRGADEERLAAIWAEVLKVERVGIHDNFFELGGDSILSIQIVARATRAGLRLTPRDLFEHPTVAELAELAVAGAAPAAQAEQGLVTGAVPLTPLQRRFFAAEPAEPHHFNLPLLLSVSPDLDPALLARAVRHLALHHDALRLRFRRGENGWEQAIAGIEALPRLTHLDLTGVPAERRVPALEAAAAALQGSLDLGHGPLLRAAFFALAPGEPGRLLLALHHLAVDGVSWRILLEDLETACHQLAAGEPVRLPAKTTSFKQWAERLRERAETPAAPDRPAPLLPVDFPATGANTMAVARSLALTLDAEETRALLTEVPAVYRTRINDVLLAALALACSRWSGERSVLVELEGHGRDAEDLPGIDLSRTVGWLTAVEPVLIDTGDAPEVAGASGAAGAGALLKSVKEQLRAGARPALPAAEIGFNYLGQLDLVLPEDSLFQPAVESPGPAVSPRGVRPHLLDLNAGVVDGRLRTAWTWSSAVHRAETIERLAAGYQQALREIVEHCLSPRAGGATPSDFPLARLAQEPLDRLLGEGPRARGIEDVYPLSPLQQGMLFHSLYAPEAAAYVVQRSAELVGELDVDAFRRAWRELIDRHAVLRTGFEWEELDRPLQVVHAEVPVPLVVEDWSGLPEDERRRRVDAWLDADRRRDFELRRPPLLRLTLLRTAPDRHRWVWSGHHLLLDGWCMSLLFDEFLRLYAAFVDGREVRLPRPRPYRDYIAWVGRQDLAAAEAYWRRTLAGFSAPTELPLARDPGDLAAGVERRRRETARVPAAVVTALQELGRHRQLTLNTLVEGAWALLLSRYAGGAPDVVFGITVSGRPAELPGVESMIGLFINTLPRRIEVEPAEPLLPWLARLQEQHLDLRQHQLTPLTEIQRWTRLPGGRLFDSIFSLENYPVDTDALRRHRTGLEILDPRGAEETDYPLDLAVMIGPDLPAILAYDSARLEPATAGRLLHHFGVLLAGLAADPERRAGDLEMLAPAESRQLLVDWNRTSAAFPEDRCLHELFAERAAATPDAMALLAPEAELTFGELDRRANRLAHHLRDRGVGPESVVGLCVERSVDLAVGLLGILKAGGAYLPLDPSYPGERLDYMLEDARVPLLLTQERLLPRLGLRNGTRALCLDSAWPEIAAESAAEPAPCAGPANLAYAIYTSGSTGRPKSALVDHRALVNYSLEMVRQLELTPSDRILQFASLAFDVLVEELFPAWLAGGAVVLPGTDLLLSVDGLQQVIRERRVTGVELPAAYWQEWVHEIAQDGGVPPSLRFVIVGSEKPSAARLATWQGFGVPLVHVFGLTETAVTSTLYKLPLDAGPADLDLPIGQPVANTAVYLLDRDLRPVPLGVPGELFIGGAGVGRGYLHRQALTAERFVPDPFGGVPGARLYRTGDLSRYRADGNLDFLGRIDHQVKIRGFRVELGEVEAALRQVPLVKDAAVVVRETAGDGRWLVAYVVPAEPGGVAADTLRSHLGERLPEHMLPGAFVFLEALPLSPNGKVDRRALPAPESGAEQGIYVAPRNAAEEVLAGIWAEVLGVERVGVEDDFFALGGDSILSLQVTSKARRAGLLINPRDLFESPTVARLALRAGGGEEATAEQGEVIGAVPLTPIQHWFFAEEFAEPHHFNLPLLLELRERVAPATLHVVLVRLLAHHDALRLRFERSEEGWRQTSSPIEGSAPWTVFDLATLPAAAQAAAFSTAGAALQASLDLTRGPLLRAALFDLGEERPQRLLLVAHHLLLDTISWRIVAEDLAQGLRSASVGEEIVLPPKTASFQLWSERLAAHAVSPAVGAELDWWAAEPRTRVARLPVDLPGGAGARSTARTFSLALDADETRALLQEVPRTSRAQIQEALVAALGMALAEWTGERLLLIDFEGHGREDLFADLDLSRTVGWFTAIYPVLLDLTGANSPAAVLKTVKDQLRAVPGSGLGHGLLRHLGPREARHRLSALPPSPVLFNYVGQLGQGMGADLPFTLGRDAVGAAQSPRAHRTHSLELNADVLDGRLRMSWTYSAALHRPATIEALGQGMAAALRRILAACRSGEAGGLTPSDFPLAARAGLIPPQLEALTAGRRAVADVYPLSPLQRGMLFDLLYQPRAGLYFGQLVCELHGELDTEAFRAAWQGVVGRHPVLRTTFHWEGLAEPLQVVEQDVPLPLSVEDWQGLPEEAQRERLALVAAAERERGFTVSGLPLMRLVLARKSDGVHQLVWSFLQILMDGWSLPLIFQEGLEAYAALRRGEAPRPVAVRDFRDYIAWLVRQNLAQAEAFWRRTLAGAGAPTPLPAADRPWSGTAGDGGGYAQHPHHVAAGLTEELRALARRQQLTLNTLVQGAWALLLARSSGEREVTFGVVVAGRPAELPGADEMVGLFINTLPARVAVPPGEAVSRWLTRLQEQAVELRGHEHTPLSEIQRWSGAPSGQSLFDTILVFENYPIAESLREAHGGLAVRELRVSEKAAFPLSLGAFPGRRLDLIVSFYRQVYDDVTVVRLTRQLESLLAAMAADPAAPLSALSLLDAAERRQLIAEWSDITAPVDQTLLARWHERVALHPEAVAVLSADGNLGYAELDRRANRLAHHLRRLGVGREVAVGVCLERSPEILAAALAVWKAGGVYVPLDPTYPAERLGFMLAETGAPVLVTRADLDSLPDLAGADSPRRVLLDLDAAALARESETLPEGGPAPSDLAYLIFTSGSTGRPKAVQVEHASLANTLLGNLDRFGFAPADVVPSMASFSFDISLFECFAPLLAGGTVALLGRQEVVDPAALTAMLGRVTAIHAVPGLMRQLVLLAEAREGSGHPGPRALFVGGEYVAPELLQRMRRVFPSARIFVLYGPTESTIICTAYEVPAEAAIERSLIGRPLAGVGIRLLDPDGHEVPAGVPGEICVTGLGVARGYLRRPELTAERFVDLDGTRAYRTGDLARRRPDGNLEFLGRIDGQVKIRGFRIEPGEIEAVLSGHPAVGDAAVLAQGGEEGGGERRLVAWFVPAAEPAPTAAALRAWLGERLPDYMVPALFVPLPELPRLPTGKLDRRALPAPDPAEGRGEGAAVEPRNSTEEALAAIWRELLGVERVGIHDDFFELGGDSILSIQIVARANQGGIRLTPRQVFELRTIAALAAAAGSAPAVSADQGLVAGPVPLTPIQRRFFEHGPLDPHHANLSLLLEPRLAVPAEDLPALLDRAVRRLFLHHDALRLRFHHDGAEWRQVNAGAEGVGPLACVDLSGLARAEREGALASALAVVQGSLDLAGPLARAVYFALPPGEPGRLLFAVHHLVVDGVSWRVLLEDLQTVTGELARGGEAGLPAKTTSFKSWAERLAEHASSAALASQLPHWLGEEWRRAAPLPVDSTAGENSVASGRSVAVSLDLEETAALLHRVPEVYRTEINDLLLTALARTLMGWTGQRVALVELEGHGREDLFDDVDLSRTVGWFTTAYPVLLDAGDVGPGEGLRAVKEQLRAIPGRGLGYGLLLYLGEPGTAAALRDLPAPEVSFNYLGQLDQVVAGALAFVPAREPAGAPQSPRARREHLLAVGAQVLGGRLRVDWSYSENRHRGATVEALARRFLAELRALIAHCLTPGAGLYSPSDFPLARLRQDDLDRILASTDTTTAGLPAVPRQRVVEDIYPLTPMQQGMLFHTLYEPESGEYFEQLSPVLYGDLDPAAFRAAWQRVVDRHPVLRTALVWEGTDESFQVVLSQVELPWREEDWRGLPGAAQRERLEDWLRADRRQGFDLTRAPLQRMALIRLSEDAWQVVWSHHHLLLDAWCRPLVFREVLTFYEAFRQGRDSDLPRPRPYREYIAWLQRQDLAAAEAFWRQTLRGLSEPTPFGVDRAAVAGGAPEDLQGRRNLPLPLAVTSALEAAALRHQVTLSTLVQAAWAALLARLGGTPDVVFGTVVSGRPADLPGVEAMIGMFINTLPVRVAVPARARVGAWLAGLQAQQLELRQYEHTPLVEAQRWSGLPSGRRLFESAFVFLNSRRDASVLAGGSLRVGEMRVAEKTELPLTVIADLRRELLLELQFDARRFEPVAVERMLGHFQNLLTGLAEDDGAAPLESLRLLAEPERHQLLVEWLDTAAPAAEDATLHGLFAAQVRRTPEAVALVAAEGAVTYRELDARADRLARRLRSLGIGAEDRVGLCVTRSSAMAVGILGALKAGAAWVPLDPANPGERLEFLLADSAVAALLTEERLAASLPLDPPGTGVPRILLPLGSEVPGAEESGERTTEALSAGPANAAYVIYTSGSTGQPKGVVVAHAEVVHYALEMVRQLRLRPDDRVLQFASLGFDVVVEELFPAWLAGAAVVLHERDLLLSVLELEEVIDTHGVTGLELPAAYWQEWVHELAASGRPAPRSLRWVIVGSEKPQPERVAAWQRLGIPLIYIFGLTETTVTSTLHRLPAGELAPDACDLPVGRPVANARLYVLDREGRPVPAGLAGELYIGGAGLARAYHGRPALTAERFVPDPFAGESGARLYRTGDLARFRWSGELDFLGRLDDQVKVRGFRVELGEVEAALLALEEGCGVREAAVLASPSPGGGNRLVACVVPERGREVSAPALRDALRRRLPEHMVPAAFVILPELPLTSHGKVDRRALARLAVTADEGARPGYVAPRNDMEALLAGIWAEVLRVERVGAEDNFFELGGDSILSIQVTSRACRAGVRLTPRQVFEHPTVAELARVAGSAEAVEAQQGPVTGPLPLTPIQHWFFAAQPEDPHHFNLPLLLDLRAGWETARIARALDTLAVHHDALRLRFTLGEDGWRQHATEPGEGVPLAALDLSALPDASRTAEVERVSAALQATLDLTRGPLLRAALFDLGPSGRRLLLAFHHLVVDSVSLQILVEDLAATCERLSRGEAPALPPKTTSFQRWAERLTERARSAEIVAEAEHWLAESRAEVFPLPVDEAMGVNTEASARTLSVTLDEEETRALLQEVPRAYRTQINDVLLTSLAQGFASWTGDPLLLVDLEGHGREEDLFAGVDLSRTVGWFATLYPVLLDLRGLAAAGPALKAVKEQLRAIPGRGIGYGLLRFLRGDEIADSLRDRPRAEVLFNYLGQIGRGGASELPLELARERMGPTQSRRARRTHLLEVNAEVLRGRLRVSWGYSENLHRRSTIERLAEGFLVFLRALIDHCRSSEAGGFTPSDFPHAGLDQERLDRLLAGEREIEDLYPLSPLQQGMLFHALYAPEAGVYMGQLHCELLGRLEVDPFQGAWQRVVDRHAVLRTTFRWQDLEAPLQVVHPHAKLSWERQDWRGLSAAEQELRLAEYLAEDRRRGFDLTRPPLMRLLLARTSEEAHQLVWSFHQILLDGWSLPLVFREGFALYEAAIAGRDLVLPPSPPFRDYVAWLARQDRQRAEIYWRAALEGISAPTPLPVDRAEGASGDRAYSECALRLSAAATASLQEAARRHQLTLNTLVQGAWALLLGRHAGEDDVVFGATVSGRPAELPAIEAMVGLFINSLPVRVALPVTAAVVPWLRGVQESQAELRQYEYTALSDIQKWSRIAAGRPLFDSLLVVENYPIDEALREQEGSLRVMRSRTAEKANFPLTAVAMPSRELTLSLAYYRERFDDTTIARLLGHLGVLLEELLAEPERALGAVPLLSLEERHQLASEWSDTGSPAREALCVHAVFAARAGRDPEATALLFRGEALTCGELNARANRLAHSLRGLGAAAGVPVAVCLDRSPDLVVAALAIFKAGAVYVPLDPAYPAERLAFVLEDSAAPLLITESRLAEVLPRPLPHAGTRMVRTVRLDAEREEIAAHGATDPEWEVGRGDLAYLIYTSGSTGRPKAVGVEHGSLANIIAASGARFGFTPSDRMPHLASFSFDISLFELLVPLTAGAVSLLLSRQEIVDLEALAAAVRDATVIHAVPGLMRQIAGHIRGSGRVCTGLRQVFVGGDAVPPDLLVELGQVFPRADVTVLYGPTEATIICASLTVTPGDPPAGNVLGRPLDNAVLRLLDRHGRQVPIGAAGEVWIGGPGVARGYFNREELTAEKFVRQDGERFYRTGDLARHRPDGTLEFLGRADQQVKVRGFRIELGEVEAVLLTHPAVREVTLLARQDGGETGGGGDRRLVAYIVPTGEPAPTTSELHRFAQERLPDHMVPAAFVLLESLPLLPNGKVDRGALPAPGSARPELEKAYLAPRDEIEEQLAAIWREVLGLEQVGVDDNFFELGGDSLLSIQIVAKANQRGLRLTPRQLFENPTIARLALMVGAAPEIRAEQGPVEGPVPLTPIQQRFFADNVRAPHHGNQSLLLEVREALDSGLLEQALQTLPRHHDALRLRFRETGSGWEQRSPREDEPLRLGRVDLSGLAGGLRRGALEAAAARTQASLDLTQGPRLRFVLFNLGPGQPPRLLVVIHHLLVDGVSWRILLEDLVTAYRQLGAGEVVALPNKTTSFKQWADRLVDHSRSGALDGELAYWLAEARAEVRPLPGEIQGGVNTLASTATLSVTLDEEETRTLLQDVPRAYQTQINDALLTAVALAVRSWTGAGLCAVDLEGHGREELFEDMDVSRTVGWFTSLYPVLLDVRSAPDVGSALKAVKEQLRAVPNRGVGYGLLRYLHGDAEVRERLRNLPAAEISFNFMGQLDQGLDGTSPFGLARESMGEPQSPTARRTHLIEVDGRVLGGRLRVDWAFSREVHRTATIERLSRQFLEELRALIAHCLSPEAGGYTPSDFPLMSLSQDELDELVADDDDYQ
jgi:amino acid adenylation domain-containing protein/non-ribosomal peptide synthase protein (TIGR01720 family)